MKQKLKDTKQRYERPFSVTVAAQLLEVTPRTVHRWLESGKLTGTTTTELLAFRCEWCVWRDGVSDLDG